MSRLSIALAAFTLLAESVAARMNVTLVPGFGHSGLTRGARRRVPGWRHR
jgi:hypothetical protein